MTAPNEASNETPHRVAGAPPVLRLDGLGVDFGRARGLEPVWLDVAAGERVAVLGASGAGKTTLLRAVAGLAPAREGRVLVAAPGGGPLRDVTALPPERRDVVYLHQTPTPFAHLSVADNVAFPLRLRRVRGAELARRVRDALALVRLTELAERMPHALSGGQRHRVALARAIVARPAVLLLDEPLAALDPSLRDDVRAAIVRAQEGSGEGGGAAGSARPALVLVTHDLDEAGLLAHRVAVLAGGRVLQVAPPAELFARPASLAVARFLGLGAEVAGVVGAGGRFACALGEWPVALPPGPAAAVVRPDALRLVGEDAAGGGAVGEVLAVRVRARQTAAQVRVAPWGAAPAGVAPAVVEVALAPGAAVPAPGDRVCVAADPRAVATFAA